ncbi:exocyst complex component Sec5-domain-containing protein [Radiomyces spectabilis]|uniref:exocyst complex component Sec5-domain-containing protein n=1 Tax=Radiomyces spectabilis TaxID=64574 RepID=UPI00221FEE79|nr:exocyst complex component Sec5-domain-containing protein [Radiomyces spectabilis]KAI8393547.1 exocyst complex component Sec5-domain-containing protein [Radiomyces spectabilis]
MDYRREVQEYAEDAAILRFYNLDSLEPEVWTDEATGHQDEQESTLQQFSRAGMMDAHEPALRDTENETDLQMMDDSDPLGIHASIFENKIPRNANISQLKEQSSLIVSNKSFNPQQFLLQVHKHTTYNDLVAGEEYLRRGVDKRAEALKSLVHTNFDRFVSAKTTIDHVYEEMKSKQLNAEQEFGTRNLEKALEDANSRADQIYGPIVERRQKVEKVRSTLNILQRYKFFFNLPSSLLESIKQNKYETAIRDYKRGKYLYQVLKGNEESDSTNEAGSMPMMDTVNANADTTDLHRKVFDKVWAEVNKIVAELQNVLYQMLADAWRSMDEQEKTINFLFDLDTTEDPAWFYLDSQYQWTMGLMQQNYDANVEKIEKLKQASDTMESDVQRNIALKRAIDQAKAKNIDLNLIELDSDHESELKLWQMTQDLVQSLSALLLRCLPDFWRLSKAFIEGKFANKAANAKSISGGPKRRRQGVDLAKVENCQKMTRNIVDRYARLISNYFDLDQKELETARRSDGNKQTIMPKFLPVNTNSIHVSEYLTRIITDLANCVNDISSIHLPGEAFSGLTDLMEKARWKFVDVLCACWERDAKTFYLLEEWVLDPESPQYTGLLKRYYMYHKFCARSAYKMSHLTAVSDEVIEARVELSPRYIGRIRNSFLDSTYTFLDGLVQLAFSDYKPLNEKDELQLIKKRDKIDVHSMDIRILLTVSNLGHMRSNVLRKLVGLFEAAYKCNMEEDLKTLIEVVDQLDHILFNDYIKRKSSLIRDIIRRGILSNGIDWFSISKPTEVHSFVYKALMTMVVIHSQVSSVAKQLIHRALSALLEAMAKDCLESFREIERFGMGGMLQATLEIEFMHQTLSQYVTSTASETLQLIYQTIEQAYDPQRQHSGNLQSELNHVKELLVFSRKSTVLQFLCFKQNKDRKRA